jgi:hypothetical protein
MTRRRPSDRNGERPPRPLPNESVATHDDQESLGVRVATTTGKAASNAPGEPVADQLRRRREASYRMQPLPDGRRDPLDPKPRRRPLRVLSVTEDSTTGLALLRGVGSRQLAVDLGLIPQWSEFGRGWVVDAAGVRDLIAFGEHLHYVVSWRERSP